MTSRPSDNINAQCTTTNPIWALLNNINDQDPCTVVSLLGSPCNNDMSLTVPPLKPGTVYGIFGNNRCQCSFQAYNLYAACAACQSTEIPTTDVWLSLGQWQDGCNGRRIQSFTLNPEVLALPSWTASQEDDFNITSVLLGLGASPDQASPNQSSIPSDSPPTSSTHSIHSSISTKSAPPPTPSSSTGNQPISATSHSSSSKNSIISGVVGGLAALIAVGLVAYYFYYRRSNKRRAASSEFMQSVPPSARLPQSAASFPPVSNSRTALRGASEGDEDALPPFSQGSFKGPVFEKGGYVNVNGNPVTYGLDSASPSASGYRGMVESPYQDSPYTAYRGDDSPYSVAGVAGVGSSGGRAGSLPYSAEPYKVEPQVSFFEPSSQRGYR